MFGVSFPELVVLGTVALLVLGPEKLPGMLRTMGQWIAKVRRLTTEVRNQSGIDDVLRAEGFDGGLNELRSMMRGAGPAPSYSPARPLQPEPFVSDRSREYPTEGPDAYGALPEDLVAVPVPETPAVPVEPAAPATPVEPAEPATAVQPAEPAATPATQAAGQAEPTPAQPALNAGAPSAPRTDGTAPPEPNG